MRTDAITDHRLVECFKTSLGGYKAHAGDLITYREYRDSERNEWHERTARVICRIKSAPKLDPKDREVKNFLRVLVLGESLDHCYERWIDPNDVYRIETNIEDQRKLMATFLGDWSGKSDEYLIQFAESGYKSFEDYDAYRRRCRIET